MLMAWYEYNMSMYYLKRLSFLSHAEQANCLNIGLYSFTDQFILLYPILEYKFQKLFYFKFML